MIISYNSDYNDTKNYYFTMILFVIANILLYTLLPNWTKSIDIDYSGLDILFLSLLNVAWIILIWVLSFEWDLNIPIFLKVLMNIAAVYIPILKGTSNIKVLSIIIGCTIGVLLIISIYCWDCESFVKKVKNKYKKKIYVLEDK